MRVALALAALTPASAFAAEPAPLPAPAGYTEFYRGPTRVNLAGRTVSADIALSANLASAKSGDLRVALTTDVAGFVAETEADLKAHIAGLSRVCGERWSASDPEIAFPERAMRFRMGLTLEYWTCGWDGKGAPQRVTQDSGVIDVTLAPYVETGMLQARLAAFDIEVTKGLGKYLPLEFAARRALEDQLKKLNQNPKFTRAPDPLYSETFRYESIAAVAETKDRIIITARYRTIGEAQALARIAARMKQEGLTQPQSPTKLPQ